MKKVRYLCCGYRTLDERGAFDICPVCFWEDDCYIIYDKKDAHDQIKSVYWYNNCDDEDYNGEDIFDRTFKNGYRRLNIDYRSLQYSITQRGDKFVSQKLLPNITDATKAMLSSFKKKICDLSTSQLLYYVYSRYEQYTTKSKIKDKVLSTSIVMPEDSFLVDPSNPCSKDGDSDD